MQQVTESSLPEVIERDLGDYNFQTQSYPVAQKTSVEATRFEDEEDSDDEDEALPPINSDVLAATFASPSAPVLALAAEPEEGTHTYLHFGLEAGLAGKSIGVTQPEKFRRLIELMASTKFKENLSFDFIRQTFPDMTSRELVISLME